MPVKINGATSGSVTLAAPNTGSDVTLTLPSASGTVQTVPGAWTDYTPTWNGSGNSIGNGTLAGRYTQVGKTVHMMLLMVWGSTTTNGGAANWSWSLPVATSGIWVPVGSVKLFDSSTSQNLLGQAELVTASTFWITYPGTATYALSPGTPWTWASGDFIRVNLTYEAA